MSKSNLPPVTITLDREYKFRLTIKSIRALSKEVGRDILTQGIFDDNKNIDLRAVAATIAHGLQEDSPGITTDQVMDLVDARQLPDLYRKIAEALGVKPEDYDRPTKPEAT